MPRARIVLLTTAALVCVVAIAVGVYLYRSQHATPAAPIPALVGQLPGNAPAIAYIDVAELRTLKNSPLASLLGLAAPGPEEDRQYQDFVRNTGFDYGRDLYRAALAFWPVDSKSPPSAKNNSKTKPEATQSNDILAIAEGRFDRPKIQSYATQSGGVTISSGKHSLYQVPGDPPVFFEFLSSTRVILASGPAAEAHLLAADFPGIDPSIGLLVNHVSGAPFFAVARADAIPPAVYAALGQSQAGEMANRIQGLTLAGQPKADSLELALDAQCDSIPSALQISTLLGGFRILGSLAMSDPKTKSQMTKEQAALLAALLDRMQINQQGNWVRISLAVTPDMLAAAARR